jgi:hypothetical protein
LVVDFRRVAMAAVWGAAAEVSQNGLKGGAGYAVVTQSAAVMSGFRRSRPPPAKRTLPGVMGVPFGW